MTENTVGQLCVQDRFEAGMAIRKRVLGDEHVQRSLDNVTEFSRPIQELVTEYCWGAVWTREGLELRHRSMINLAMLTVLNRGHELGVHVRGAVTNGVTKSEIQEILMQAAIYAGVPASLESFRIAEETLAALELQGIKVP
jgi:4-carboxymuconolactone decarboxylase